jgi:hypothetical protein
LKITKSRLIQIIKEELDKEVVDREKKDALEAMLASAEDGKFNLGQLGLFFRDPNVDIKKIEEKLKDLDGEKYINTLLDLLYQQKPIDPEGNPLEFSS